MIQLHLQVRTKDVNSIAHLVETYPKTTPVLKGIHSY
jgi:hypothetical protein